MQTITAAELEAGDVIIRKTALGGPYSIRLSYAGIHDGGFESDHRYLAWEGTSQYGTPRHGTFGLDEKVEVTSR